MRNALKIALFAAATLLGAPASWATSIFTGCRAAPEIQRTTAEAGFDPGFEEQIGPAG
jgi:hypothetical protein